MTLVYSEQLHKNVVKVVPLYISTMIALNMLLKYNKNVFDYQFHGIQITYKINVHLNVIT